MKVRIAVNGFGSIGRSIVLAIHERSFASRMGDTAVLMGKVLA